tara:strand:- start:4036 stop:4695 length:660 start_codon:yes stop_codon:yes gene_type:complete
MSTNTQKPITANPIEMIKFHGIGLFIYSTGNQKYIPIRPITDLVGTDWRTARKSLISGDNADLFGTTTLLVPKIDNSGGLMLEIEGVSTPLDNPLSTEDTQKNELIDILCIRLDRVHMYLARINTSRLRANGNTTSADYLLKLQHEWADALHDYETNGIAVNKTIFDNTKQLKVLVDIYSKLTDKQQKLIISKQIDHALGIHRSDSGNKQLDMLDRQGS